MELKLLVLMNMNKEVSILNKNTIKIMFITGTNAFTDTRFENWLFDIDYRGIIRIEDISDITKMDTDEYGKLLIIGVDVYE